MHALQVVPVEDTAAALRALILDDAREDVELLLYELKSKGFAIEATVTHNRDEFLAALKEGSFDVVLPTTGSGVDGTRCVRGMKATGKDIPFLLVTGTLAKRRRWSASSRASSDTC